MAKVKAVPSKAASPAQGTLPARKGRISKTQTILPEQTEIKITVPTTGNRIRARRLELGMSLNRAAQEIGCTATTLKRWEEGDIKSLKTTRLDDIAHALKTTQNDLLGLSDYVISLPGVKAVKAPKRVPIKNSAKAVKSVDLVSSTGGDVILPPGVNAEYAYTMPDDAMINARIFKGDQVYIKRVKSSSEVKNGEIALVVFDDKAVLRRVYRFKGYMDLRAENPTYPPITFEGLAQTGVEIIGKAVAFMTVL